MTGFFSKLFHRDKKIAIGPHTEITISDWKKDLRSNLGVYKKIEGGSSIVRGPHLTKNFDAIVGDADTVEDFVFLKHATEEQKKFFRELWQTNRPAAREYIFALIGATQIWKTDIKLFQETMSVLRTGEVILREEEDEVKRVKTKERMLTELPPALLRHFPDIMGNLKKDYSELDDLLADLEIALRKFSSREAMISDHVNRLKATHPFLFEE